MEKFLHAVNCAAGGDRRVLARWWNRFGNWRIIWERVAAQILREAGRRFDVDAEFARLWDRDIKVIGRENPEYPSAFLHVDDAPFILYRKGAALHALGRKIAVVGTRRPSDYGKKIAYDLAEGLAERGFAVVSGLAFGIDAVAHFAAVSCEKPTVAVLASGLFDVTPSSHRGLAQRLLAAGGTLLSEYPPDAPAFAVRFLERNRIIAAMSEATVVVEAGQRSGALATANFANKYGKDVYAVCGDLFRDQARGCLELIYNGAIPLTCLQWFFEDLPNSVRPWERYPCSSFWRVPKI